MELLEKIYRLQAMAASYADSALVRDLDGFAGKIKEGRFYVVVAGLFKRGKSTLINALLGKEIAPVAVTPLTAIVSLIDYSSVPGVEIHFNNGETAKGNIESVYEYVTEEQNPENKKQVNYVHILDNADLLQDISLVDTPGLGSTYEHNTEATLAFIPKVDAALFILSADIPISKTDMDLLRILDSAVPQIIYVFNKSDLVGQEDLNKLVTHNKKVIAKELQKDITEIDMLVVSGGKNDVAPLMYRLLCLSKGEKKHLLEQSTRRQFDLLCSRVALQVRLKRDMLLLPIHELEEKQERLDESLRLMNGQKEDFEGIIQQKIKFLQQNVHDAVEEAAHALRDEVYQKIDELLLQDSSGQLRQTALKRINDCVLERFSAVRETWEAKSREHFRSLLEEYTGRSQSFLNELAKNLASLLDFDFALVIDRFDLGAYTSFYLTLDSGKVPETNENPLIKWILPKYAKRQMQKTWKAHYNDIIIHNGSSIIYDLQYKIQESFRHFNYDLKSYLEELLSGIRDILDNTLMEKSGKQADITEQVGRLSACLTELESWQQD